ncbi:MAG: YggT family protein [Coriobacteriia bacterium]|nr:YggT family protein [Coriobacteriia bacterium]MCL2749732.1 YggT family protein [Coriobacteriia bacterium]
MPQLVMILNAVITFYTFVVLAWVILSWFKGNKVARDIYKMLDPLVAPYVNLFRKILPPMGGMDFSPLVAIIVLQIAARLLFGLLL